MGIDLDLNFKMNSLKDMAGAIIRILYFDSRYSVTDNLRKSVLDLSNSTH